MTARSTAVFNDYVTPLTPQFPGLGTGPVPVEPYISPAVFEQECSKVFRKAWLYVGRTTQLPRPGDYFTVPMPALRTSLLVVRGSDGKVRVFHNVCTHRANKLAWDERGNCRGFSCKYHGWTFNLDGTVRSIPGADRLFADKATLNLKAVACDEFETLVFVNLDSRPEQTLVEFLGELGAGLRGFPFHDFPKTYVMRATLKANWKILMDAFLESYHFPALHRRTAGGPFLVPEHPFGKMATVQLFEYHRRKTAVAHNPDFVPPPVLLASMMPWGNEQSPDYVPLDNDKLPASVNMARLPDWVSDNHYAFPNTLIQLYRNQFMTYRFIPVDLTTSMFELAVHVAEPKTAAQAFAAEARVVFLRDIFLEDLSNCENIQEVIGGGAVTEMHLHDVELLVRHQASAMARYIAAH